jgi:hypothetical protein
VRLPHREDRSPHAVRGRRRPLVTAFPGRRGRGTGTWYAGRRFSNLLGTVSTQRKDVPNQFGS